MDILKAATTTIIAVIGSSSLINISETYRFSKKKEQPISNQNHNGVCLAISNIRSMKRKELIELYLSPDCCAPQKVSNVSGVWNAELLNNNAVMVSTHGFILLNISVCFNFSCTKCYIVDLSMKA